MREDSRRQEKGMTLVIMAFAIVALLAMAGLAIDLASLYVARSEAQRAADAAALAGAQSFVTSGYTSGVITAGQAKTIATQQAIDVGTQNKIGDQAPSIGAADVTFSFPCAGAPAGAIDPCITVTAQRSAARGNPMPTFFMKIFGVNTADVSANATAEAFNPSGSNVPVGTKCLKPWLMPNCDPNNTSPANPNCPFAAGYFVNPTTPPTIARPGLVSSGGVIGQELVIKPGDPSAAAVSSKFYPVFLPPGSVASTCPSCAQGGGGGGAASGSLYRTNIECCNQNTIVCGQQTVTPITGNMVGPTRQGVDCLIHQGNQGTGQDTLDPSTLQITAGANNPFSPAGTVGISSSDSVVTVPLYDGSALTSGMSGNTTVQVVGFMQMFIVDEENPQGTVRARIMSISACAASSGGGSGGSGGGSGSGGPVVSGSGSPVPVRLIHN